MFLTFFAFLLIKVNLLIHLSSFIFWFKIISLDLFLKIKSMRVFNNLLLLSILIPLFSYCQRSLTPDWHEQVIANYIRAQLAQPEEYQGKIFKIIDQEYLESQPVITDSISALRGYYHEVFSAIGSKPNLPLLKLDTLDVYINYLPQFKDVHNKTVNELTRALQSELDFLNQVLIKFNLSIYHPLPTDSLIVYHEYSTNNSIGQFAYQSVFEIDLIDKDILAEKILNQSRIL